MADSDPRGAPDFKPGVVVSGRLLSEEIGQGGFSRVFRAEPVGGGEAVAIKVAVRPELVSALHAEGAVLRRLRGPRFVEILEEHLDADPPYFVLELCPGGDLRALLDRAPGKRLAPDEVLRLGRSVLEGVAFAHEEGIVHGDLKPENVLLDAKGEPKIGDLGLSRVQRRQLLDQVAPSILTEPGGKVRGTLDYLAPEVRKGGEVTPASDVYALGVLLYEMLVGARPVGAFRMPAGLLARDGVTVPVALDRVVGRALAHDPLDRYAGASVMLADLQAGDAGIELARTTEAARSGAPNPLLLGVEKEAFIDEVLSVLVVAVPGVLIPTGAGVGLLLSGLDSAGEFVVGLGAALGVASALSIAVGFAVHRWHVHRMWRRHESMLSGECGAEPRKQEPA